MTQAVEGTLEFESTKLVFNSKGVSFEIPVDQIEDAMLGSISNAKEMAMLYAAVGMLSFMMKKDKLKTMLLSFKDQKGILQHPEFAFLPKTIKEVNLVDEAMKKLYELRVKAKENIRTS